MHWYKGGSRMGFFDFFRIPDINQKMDEYRNTEGAVLLDVRTPEEFREGRIPGSRNVPLQVLNQVTSQVPAKDTPIFVYCWSGSRSGQAVSILRRMGYTSVTNLGGIAAYSGRVEQ